jgi:hypothetical protein
MFSLCFSFLRCAFHISTCCVHPVESKRTFSSLIAKLSGIEITNCMFYSLMYNVNRNFSMFGCCFGIFWNLC